MSNYKTYFNWWFDHDTKSLQFLNYREPWKENCIKPIWEIRTNGARRENGDKCFDLTIHIGYLILNYTDWDLQKDSKKMRNNEIDNKINKILCALSLSLMVVIMVTMIIGIIQ